MNENCRVRKERVELSRELPHRNLNLIDVLGSAGNAVELSNSARQIDAPGCGFRVDTGGSRQKRTLPIGASFGRWTILIDAKPVRGLTSHLVRCSCPAKTERVVIASALRHGRSLSCGCLKVERQLAYARRHGMSHTPEHRAWDSMQGRCFNPTNAAYLNYGGRGIKVCGPRDWLETQPRRCAAQRTNPREPGQCKMAAAKGRDMCPRHLRYAATSNDSTRRVG